MCHGVTCYCQAVTYLLDGSDLYCACVCPLKIEMIIFLVGIRRLLLETRACIKQSFGKLFFVKHL